MNTQIISKCDDCGTESDRTDLYDAPWADNKVRCADCFLKFCGYDLDAVNEWAKRMADMVRKHLEEVQRQEIFDRDIKVINDVILMCATNDAQWGGPAHDDKHDPDHWIEFIQHQIHRAASANINHEYSSYRMRIIKIAALAIQAAQSFDRKI